MSERGRSGTAATAGSGDALPHLPSAASAAQQAPLDRFSADAAHRLPDTVSRDARLNMKPMILLRELESEHQLMQELHSRYSAQLAALKSEEEQLLALRNMVLARGGSSQARASAGGAVKRESAANRTDLAGSDEEDEDSDLEIAGMDEIQRIVQAEGL